LREAECFKYLESVIEKNDGSNMTSMKNEWMKWRDVSSILCDKYMLLSLKSRFHLKVRP